MSVKVTWRDVAGVGRVAPECRGMLGLKLLRLLGEPGNLGRSVRLPEHPDEFVRRHALPGLLRYPNLTPR